MNRSVNDRPHLAWPILVLVLSVSCMLAGCGSTEHNAMVGTWRISRPDALGQRVNAGAESESRMVLVFYWNGQLETETRMGAVASKKQGTWQVVGGDPSKQETVISCQLQGQTTEHTVTFIDDDTIRLVPPNMAGVPQALTFVRN